MLGERFFEPRMLVEKAVEFHDLCMGHRSGGLPDEFAVDKPAGPSGEFGADFGVVGEKLRECRMILLERRIADDGRILAQPGFNGRMLVEESSQAGKLAIGICAGVCRRRSIRRIGRTAVLGESGHDGKRAQCRQKAKGNTEVLVGAHNLIFQCSIFCSASITVSLRPHYSLAMFSLRLPIGGLANTQVIARAGGTLLVGGKCRGLLDKVRTFFA